MKAILLIILAASSLSASAQYKPSKSKSLATRVKDDSATISQANEKIYSLEKANAKKGAAESIMLPKLVEEVRRQDSIIAVLRQELLKKGQ